MTNAITNARTNARTNAKKGVLLINLGTPEGVPGVGPSVAQVRDYLGEFLMDPYVIDIPYLARWLLVHGIILRTRPAKSAEAYKKVWTSEGSPLKTHHLHLARALHERIGSEIHIEPAMRYGTPSIPTAFAKLKATGVTEVLILPLYPQYSLSATESSLEMCRQWLKTNWPELRPKIFQPFFKAPGFIESFSKITRDALQGFDYEHLLFSFHGLPERHIRKTDHTKNHCLSRPDCCEHRSLSPSGEGDCYRAQCFSTAREMARVLGLKPTDYSVCFQSRLSNRWILPHTDVMYREMAEQGVKKIAVVCPAFVADCLETIEEIGIRARQEFIEMGGTDLKLVPSLNATPEWSAALSQMIQREFSA